MWRAIGWTADGNEVVAIGESERHPQDLWLLPAPGSAGASDRPRPLTDALPALLRSTRWAEPERIRFDARDGLPIEATLWRPAGATGRRGADRVPAIVFAHGGPTGQSFRSWQPFKQLLVREGFAVLDVDFRGSTGYGRAFREANRGEWGHADAFDCIDAALWLEDQPWCDGRLAVYGGSYGGYLTLCCLVEEPSTVARRRSTCTATPRSPRAIATATGPAGSISTARWAAPMTRPSPTRFRRGSPLYRAERIEAPRADPARAQGSPGRAADEREDARGAGDRR